MRLHQHLDEMTPPPPIVDAMLQLHEAYHAHQGRQAACWRLCGLQLCPVAQRGQGLHQMCRDGQAGLTEGLADHGRAPQGRNTNRTVVVRNPRLKDVPLLLHGSRMLRTSGFTAEAGPPVSRWSR